MVALLDTFLRNKWIVQPTDSNMLETAHGGNVMKWMDEVGALSAMRFAGETCVTARMSQVDFRRPIPTGNTAVIEGFVYDAGRTSVRVHLTAYSENPRTGERDPTTEAYFVYVAIDDERTPVAVPDLVVESDRGAALRRTALDGERT
jgi:acyl-CoA hydrolase